MANEEEHVLYGGPDCDLVEGDAKSLGEVVQRMLLAAGDREIIVDATLGQTINAAELLRKSVQLAHCLQASGGVVAGDVIGLCSENRTQFPVPIIASFLLGASLAPINPSYTDRELQHVVNLCHPKIIFASALVVSRIADCSSRNRCIQKIVSLDETQESPIARQRYITLEAFLGNAEGSSGERRSSDRFECTARDMRTTTALVLCSSGTTGLPKGVELTQFNVHTAVSQMTYGLHVMSQMGMGDLVTLNVVPWFHSYGLLVMIGLVLNGRRLVTLGRFEERAFLQAIQQHKCNTLFAVPPLVAILAKSPLVDEYDLSSLLMIFSGAAPLSKSTADAALVRIPSALGVFQGFGMSETTLSVLQQSAVFCSEGSVGVLRPGIWGKIVDVETGRNLAAGQRGEMCFKGASIMKGYLGDEAATRQTIDADQWLHTGDIGYCTAEGEWFIVDRLKELIKYNGFQVPPAELEAILVAHPDVLDAGVIGVADERVGEKAKAFVVKRGGSTLTEHAVQEYVADKVSFAKRLHGGVQFVTQIPKNQTGKILRRQLRELQQSGLQSKL